MCPNYKEGDGVGDGIGFLYGGESYSCFLSFPLFKCNDLAFLSQECTQHYSLLVRHNGHDLTKNKDSQLDHPHRLIGQTLKSWVELFLYVFMFR